MEAAFFDLDKTVIAKASVVAFGTPLYREGLISRRTILRALWGQLVYLHLGADEAKIARMRASVLALTKGWDQVRISEIVEDALESVIVPIIYGEALELMASHRAAGRRIVIVSASPAEIVVPLAEFLGADDAIASRARIDAEGRYTGEMAFDAFGPSKVVAMGDLARRYGIDLDASYAYSDSATDIPMLEAVGHPVAVNADRELAKVAAERGWESRVFARPVRPVRGPRARRAAPFVAAGMVVLGAGAGAVWWWQREQSRESPVVAAVKDWRALLPLPAPPWSAAAVRPRGLAQSTRSFLAATTPRATRMARRMSFFIPAG
jgi:HAD superfamily hydrolase (TIGR01490 family)